MKTDEITYKSIIAALAFATLACGQFSLGIIAPTPEAVPTQPPYILISPSPTSYVMETPWITQTYPPYETAAPPLINPPIIPPDPYPFEGHSSAAATATRIEFQPGMTYFNSVTHQIAANGIDMYILWVNAGQELGIGTTPTHNSTASRYFSLTVYGVEDGTVLAQDAIGGWQGFVPASQDYLVVVTNHGEAVDTSIRIQIPLRIEIAPGNTTSAIEGVVAGWGANVYVVRAEAGQTVSVRLQSPGDAAVLTLSG